MGKKIKNKLVNFKYEWILKYIKQKTVFFRFLGIKDSKIRVFYFNISSIDIRKQIELKNVKVNNMHIQYNNKYHDDGSINVNTI